MTRRTMRILIAAGLAVLLAVGGYLLLPSQRTYRITGYFASAVGLYPGDDVRVVGVPVGRIESIEPRADSVKVTMSVHRDVPLPADVHAVLMAPNIVSARVIQLAPAYTGGERLADNAVLDMSRTAVPVEWDEIKEQLTALSAQLAPENGKLNGALSGFVNQAADTFDGNGDTFRNALRELSATAGRLGDSRTDIFGTVKNLQVLVSALAGSNEQLVQFTDHVAAVSAVMADSSKDLDVTLGTLNQALKDVRGFLHDNNDAIISQVNKLAEFSETLSAQSDNFEQVLHITPHGLVNFYNIYNPAQGTLSGLLSLPDFANPVQFICGGVFDVGAVPDNFKRAELCKERMGPVMRRWSMNFVPFLFHPINSITAYKGQIQYDTPETEAKAQTPLPYLKWMPAPGVTAPSNEDMQKLFTGPRAPGQLGPAPGPTGPQQPGAGAPLPPYAQPPQGAGG
ncbi:MCE family protein [Mycobacterium sp. M1]|uniref:MCE family protein n=1 Tax=Mycolicibacter acidiphilus TaxID=2835306 RepID=A0ABS5RJK8_9MYCO|nr:MCE family protein [Mycolicibacter acidiphilus]MBS9534466.1 MCE family protein [Mycolicibacter acidiphilus]